MSDAPPVPLHCFAHAGAGISAFHGWSADLGTGALPTPHLLPGREARRREPRVTARETLLADLFDGFRAPAAPYVLYGHSLGALVAYTLARALHEAGLPTPALLAVGACPPPDAASVLSDACREPERRLRSLLDTLGAGPPDTVPGDLWERKVLPVLRDDLVLADALRAAARHPVAGGPFRVPVLAVAGADDLLAPPPVMAGWHRWTAARTTTRTLPGDHFFVRGRALPRLLGRACRVVRRTAARPASLSTTGGRA
ncbi:thioesterase domain-containing protein [Streptomyces parvulus]|uniref:thioesterase II family protein n=1 Tax=Streptomyces TaxID=1883 RepID=UPI0013712A3C|nr:MULTISPECIES: thioesterase domain-containing protein [Streptomyces]MCC9157478.1 thioesterase domain-containing protein [Streptomyces parvulus]MCE7691531.1 thioesterase domain-containing protein [Streptomyces parvulus]MZD54091.1 thioesterase [Streptomyces sp. SID5606]WHM28572.1 thioesterase domain-containing protein [Streptomyces sp. BPPL-273]